MIFKIERRDRRTFLKQIRELQSRVADLEATQTRLIYILTDICTGLQGPLAVKVPLPGRIADFLKKPQAKILNPLAKTISVMTRKGG